MASIEFITKRIDGKRKEIAKLESKLSRILKAQASNWENNPYYYDESDLKWTTKDLENAKVALEEYEKQLTAETEKANSRNVPAILQFLDAWKERVMKYHEDRFPEYLKAKAERYEENSVYCDWMNHSYVNHATKEERDAKRMEERKSQRAFEFKWSDFIKYDECGQFDKASLQKHLDQEANRKYDDIINRTNEICGKITDASCLYVGLKGDLDGYIKGERGKAKVQTIGAGGYNIQCYHFRTLVHEAK